MTKIIAGDSPNYLVIPIGGVSVHPDITGELQRALVQMEIFMSEVMEYLEDPKMEADLDLLYG